MKKLMFFAGALLALATLAACDKSAQEPELVSYNITVDASRDASLSKAISLSGSTMNAIWGSTDKVAVYNSANTKIGTLTPQSTGSASTVLSTKRLLMSFVKDIHYKTSPSLPYWQEAASRKSKITCPL